jgi:hypothetical protein
VPCNHLVGDQDLDIAAMPSRDDLMIDHHHTDHRAAGIAAIDAVYPAARNPMAFPWLARGGFAAHKVRRVYLFWSDRPDAFARIQVDAGPEQIVSAASEAGLYSNLITAAVTLNRGRLDELAKRGLDHVQISFQDVDAKNAERIGAYPERPRRSGRAPVTD